MTLIEGMAEVIEAMEEAPIPVGDVVYIREIPNMTGLVVATASKPIAVSTKPRIYQQVFVGLPLDSFELLMPTEEDEAKVGKIPPPVESKAAIRKARELMDKSERVPKLEEEVVVAFESKPLFAGAKKPSKKKRYPPRPSSPPKGRSRCVAVSGKERVFDVKDELKPLGFRFDGPSKEWWVDLRDEEIDDMLEEVQELGVELRVET